jgi:NADH dehydrogenase [ubiquinone] 1 alpha subcomplex assembly factor 7
MIGDRRDTPLAVRLKTRIADNGPLTIAQYMEACLQDPQHGYYQKHFIGGDFVTAPEISQVFGELIGLWSAVVWQQMDRPRPVRLVELGPGHGTMMRDMLRAVRVARDFLAACEVSLIETSAHLAGRQTNLLRDMGVSAQVVGALGEVAPGASIVIGNEFLDALPAHQYVRSQTGWRERTVSVDDRNDLQFDSGAAADGNLLATLDLRFPQARPGDVVQLHQQVAAVASWMAERAATDPVAILFIDYGHTDSVPGDTLEAAREHRSEHPLASPGDADLTMHVDFESVARDFSAHQSLAVDGPVTQAEFLGALGIAERASRLMTANPADANAIEMGVQRLMAPHAMGTRFKAIGIRRKELPTLPALAAHRRPGGTPC